MFIPVFVSAPTVLNPQQEASRDQIEKSLRSNGFESRSIGKQDYPVTSPLKEIAVIARHCSGGIILGFEQFRSTSGIKRPGTPKEEETTGPVSFPTEWNNLEAGILFGLRLPLLIFKEPGISGGVFDDGVTDVFVHAMPPPQPSANDRRELREVMLRWQAIVRTHYYRFD